MLINTTISVFLGWPSLDKPSYPEVHYEGAQVWRTMMRSAFDVDFIRKMVDNNEISLWSLDSRRADYLVHDSQRLQVHRKLQELELNHTVVILDVQRRIDATIGSVPSWTEEALRVGHRMNFKSYPSIAIIDEYLANLQENFPSTTSIHTIGSSVENRPIKMIVISNRNPNNKRIIVTAGMHSREWIAITSALYIANEIVTKFDQQPKYTKNIDWYIIPLVNPDGYEYTRTTDRLWRKNRRTNLKSLKCSGVDINRNFKKFWNVVGVTDRNECFEDYAGPGPFSEPEAVAIQTLLKQMKNNPPMAYIDLHSYSQLIIYPWSVQNVEPITKYTNYLKTTAKGMKEMMYNVDRHNYNYGTVSELMYSVSGAALDWFHSEGVHLSFVIEGRDTGLHGFLLPPTEIESAGKEILAAVKHVAWVISSNNRTDVHSGRNWF